MTQITQALEALADWLDKEAFDCERNARETAMDHPQAVQSLLGARANSLRNRAATVREAVAALSSAALSSAAPSAAEPVTIQDGWKLVPIEPTRDMLEVCKISFINSHGRAPWERNRRAFRAMVAAAPPAPQAASEPMLPHPGSPEASAIIDSKLAEYNWPSNSKNAARAGFEAARALLAAHPVKPMRAVEMATATAKEYMKFFNGLTMAEGIGKHGVVKQWPDVAASEPVAWLPTSENINALPEPVRDYIHSLIANCDPAGNVADNTIKADTIRALEASNRRIRDELDTPGNRNPEARYAGHRGEPALERYTADELAAWEEGQRARVPASVAGLSGDAEREAFEAWYSKRYAYSFGPVPETWKHAAMCDAWEVWQQARAALHSTGKPQAIPSSAVGAEPGRRNPLLAYVDSYREMARMGDGRVSCLAVALDIEQNMAPLLEPPVQSTQCAAWRVFTGKADALEWDDREN